MTLRTRATMLATLVAALVLTAASVALVLTLESRLSAGADSLSRSRVADLLDEAERGTLPKRLTTLDDASVAQVVTTDGRVLAASPNVAGRPPISSLDPGEGLAVATVEAPDYDETEQYRLWAGSGASPQGPVRVYVGRSLEAVVEATATLRQTLLVGGPAVLLLLAAGTWAVVGAALRRVDRIRREVDGITGHDDLHRRVPEGAVDDELGRLAATMNRMLAGLEASRDRQRSFVADVSHDLQSPLAAQRSLLELARAGPEEVDLDRLTGDLLGTTTELERLVRDLLFLAASDAGAAAPPPVTLDLEDVVLEEAARARAGARVAVDTAGVSAGPARANRGDVQRAVRNLLDNALAHARSRVELRVSTEAGGARLDVIDDGPGIPAEDRDRVFERFHRGDAARSRDGSGLGLPIARTLAERNGGSLALESDPVGAHFVLRLPGAAG